MKSLRMAVLVVSALAALLMIVAPVGAQTISSAIEVTCPGGGGITNGVSIGVNVRPGTYLVTVIGINGFDPVLAIWDGAAGQTLNCIDDAPGAATYSALLPTTGLIAPSSFNAQLQIVNQSGDFRDFYAVIGGFGDSTGEALVIFEELAVTSADGTGITAGDPFYIEVTQNLLNSQVPLTAYMISLTNVLDPYVSLINDEAVATIDGLPVICDDAGTPARCFGDPGTLTSSYIAYTAPNGDTYNLPGYPFDAALRFDPFVLATNGVDTAEVRLSSFNQSTFGDYIAAFHVGIGDPNAGASNGAILGGSTTTTTTTTTTTSGNSASLTGSAGTTTGTTGTTTGTTTTGTTTTGSLTGSAGQTTSSATAVTCNDNARTASLASLAPGQSVVVTCPANCAGTIWGTGTYTDDSSVCRAAIHAGVIPASGGQFLLTIAPGLQSYPGSTANGITSSQWGSWTRSFIPSPVSGASVTPPTPTGGGTSLSGAAGQTTTTSVMITGSATTVTVTGTITRENNASRYSFNGTAGDVVTLTLSARPTGSFDTVLSLFDASSTQPIARNDDHGSNDPSLARFDSRIQSFTLPTTGVYTVEATSFAGAGAGEFRLDLAVERSSASGSYLLTPVGASAGLSAAPTVAVAVPTVAVAVPTTASLSGLGQATPVPTTASLSGLGQATPVPTTASLSGLGQATPVPTTASLSGLGQATPVPTAAGQGGLTATTPVTITITGALAAQQFNQTYAFTGSAGDVIDLTLSSADFDTIVALFADGQTTPLARNDDHGTANPNLNRLDSFLNSFTLPTTGRYLVDVTSFGGRATGSYTLTLTIEQAADPASYQLELQAAAIVQATPTTRPNAFVAPALTGSYTNPDGVTIPVPQGWLTRETVGGTILASTRAALDGASASPQADYSTFGTDGIAIQIVPASLVAVQPGQSADQVLSAFTGISVDEVFVLGNIADESAVVPLLNNLPPGIEAYVFAVDYAAGAAQNYGVFMLATAIPADLDFQLFIEDLLAQVTIDGASIAAAPTAATLPTAVPLPTTAPIPSGYPVLFGDPADPVIYSAPTTPIDLGDGFTVLLPDGWVFEEFDNRVLLADTEDTLNRVIESGSDTTFLAPDSLAVVVFRPTFSAQIVGSATVFNALSSFGVQMDTAVEVSGLGDGAASGVVSLDDLPDGGISYVTIVDFAGQPIVFTTITAYVPGQITGQIRDLINSVSSAGAASVVEQPTPINAEAQTFEFDDGSVLSLAVPDGWTIEAELNDFQLVGASDEAAIEATVTGVDASDLPEGTFSFALALPGALDDQGITAESSLDDLIGILIENLGGGVTSLPLTGTTYPAMRLELSGEDIPEGAQIIAFVTDSGPMVLAYIANITPEADALRIAVDLINSVVYTSADDVPPVAVATSVPTLEPGAITLETETFAFDTDETLTIGIPSGWEVDVDTRQGLLTLGSSADVVDAVNDGSLGAPDLPAGAFSMALASPIAVRDLFGTAPTDAFSTFNDVAELLGGTGTPLILSAAPDMPTAYSGLLTGAQEGLTLVTVETETGVMVIGYLANADPALTRATIEAIVGSIAVTGGEPISEPTAAPIGVGADGSPQTVEFADGSSLTITLPAGWVSSVDADQGFLTAATDENALDRFTNSPSDTRPLPEGVIAFQLGTPAAIEDVIDEIPTELDDTAIALVRALDGIGVPRELTTTQFPAVIANVVGGQIPTGLRVIVFETPQGFLLLGYIAGGDADAALETISDIIDTIAYSVE